MKKAAYALIGIGLLVAPATQAQQPDSVRTLEVASRVDSTKATDTTPSKVDTLTVASTSSTATKPEKVALKDIGTVEGGVRLAADLSAKTLQVIGSNGVIKTFKVAVGSPSYPTPPGSYTIRKIVWNPSWTPPPDAKWAKNKTAKDPGEPGNPMKVAKIFFKEPDYYIHGTGETNSLGSAASHGCLRMDPDDVAELARFLMENGGQAKEEGWFSRVMHMRWKTHTVMLSQPVKLVVTN
jgi:lipoprotein-anchoring transpeptidase ErfK/SrfK